jgi:hypothetical protein
MALAPRPAPPVPPVEVVPGVVGVVAGVLVLVEVVGGLVLLVVDWVVVVEAVVDVVTVCVGVVVTAGVLVVWWQSFWASSWTVEAPWMRLLRRVALTDAGRLPTVPASAAAAVEAPLQLPAPTAEEIRSSCPESVLDWSDESRPEPPPHAATTSETANPSPPARMARRR